MEVNLLEARNTGARLGRMGDTLGSAGLSNMGEGMINRAALEQNVEFAKAKLAEVLDDSKKTQAEVEAVANAVAATQQMIIGLRRVWVKHMEL